MPEDKQQSNTEHAPQPTRPAVPPYSPDERLIGYIERGQKPLSQPEEGTQREER